ncbi:MAG: UvrB/UvrC motif-containing protein [Pseudomonadota bacterium]
MTDPIADLQRRMDDAVAALDFETASRLRDELSILRGGLGEGGAIDTAGLTRQQPGAMGLGTSQQRMTPPPGWVKPKKPDPMTRGVSRRKR